MGPVNRRKRELEERRKLILDKSRELFFEKGFEKVSIQDICDAVEYGRSAIYALFESKEELYSYIYIDGLKILKDLSKIIDPDKDEFDSGFMKLGDIIFKFYNEYNDYFRALTHFSTKGMIQSRIPESILKQKETLYNESVENIQKLLERNIAIGNIKELDIQEFILLYYSAIIGIISLYTYAEEVEDSDIIKKAVMTHTDIYRCGIKL